MILSDKKIKEMLESGELVIDPIEEDQIQPASVDCYLDSNFLVVDDNSMGVVTMTDSIQYREIESDSIIVPAHSFVLATTREYIELPDDVTAFVEGRSSIGRMGLFVENAGWVDPGFKGNITLELYNAGSLPIKLEANRRVCQFVFCKTDQPVENPYQGKYTGQRKTVGSRVYADPEANN